MNTERSGLCCENSNCRICPVRFSRQVYIRAGSKFGGAHQKTPEDATRTAEIDWEHVSQKWNIYALPHQKHRLSCCRPKPISENTKHICFDNNCFASPHKKSTDEIQDIFVGYYIFTQQIIPSCFSGNGCLQQ